MKSFLLIVALVVPGIANARPLAPPIYRGGDYTANPLDFRGVGNTPSLRAQQLRRAIALREEVAFLVVEDGGTLSDHHRAYVKRKVRNMLTGE